MPKLERPVQLVLFDLGSTLFYEIGPWPNLYRKADEALWRVLVDAGIPVEARDAYGQNSNFIENYYARHRGGNEEPGSAAVLRELLQEQGFTAPDSLIWGALRAMYAITQTNWEVEQDAVPTLAVLRERGFRIGAVSNGADMDNTMALVEKAKVGPYLEHIVASAGFGRRKPDAGIFHEALRLFGLAPEQTVMVGDDYEADIVGGHGVGMQAIWITRRVPRPLPEAAKGEADATVEMLSEIPGLLQRG